MPYQRRVEWEIGRDARAGGGGCDRRSVDQERGRYGWKLLLGYRLDVFKVAEVAGRRAGELVLGNDVRVDGHLEENPEQRNDGKVVILFVADFPDEPIPFGRVEGQRQFLPRLRGCLKMGKSGESA